MSATSRRTRREFVARAAGVAGLGLGGFADWPGTTSRGLAAEPPVIRSPNERWRIGAIGMRYQGSVITRQAAAFGDVVAICDVDRHVREQARASFNSAAAIYEDYRDLLARDDLDVVLIGAPDHWHARMTIDACRAGKDVYVEKPLTLAVDEGQVIQRVAAETGRVVQVGTWQRHDARFRLAAELVRAGRLGKVRTVTIVLGQNEQGGPFETLSTPKHLNWERWLGQAPLVDYTPERCHYNFRYWYEYAGGEMTDTGAHHLDIALWALGLDHTGPEEISATAQLPSVENGYNVPREFSVRMRFAGGVECEILDRGRSGILFEGEAGRIFVNRGTLSGAPVEALATRPLPRESFQLYVHDNLARPERAGKIESIENHMGNFYDCVRSRQAPISSVASQHRVAAACHLGNIAVRLGRTLRYDPATERFVDDREADGLLTRPRRDGYEVA